MAEGCQARAWKNQRSEEMSLDRMIFVFAGIVVLTGVILSQLHSPWWLLLTAFAGVNMIQSAFTGFCPAAIVFKKLGAKPGKAFE